MIRTKVDSVEEAVRIAEELKRLNRTYWFRGQTKDWPVRSTLARVAPEDHERALDKLARYEGWIGSTPGLENLASNVDAAVAVAQHYGLPTNFVDFTTEPKIAAFFASENAGPDTETDLACIVCLDIEDLKEFCRFLPNRYSPPEYLQMEVPDLWRLEAQHGCFLYCPYDHVERIYGFDRIYFPNTQPLKGISSGDVYPERKSHLEVLLDQYFMNESMIEFERKGDTTEFETLFFNEPDKDCDAEIYPNGIPEHQSWSDAALRPWLELPEESFDKARTEIHFQISVQDLPTGIYVADQLLRDLFSQTGIRNKLVGWEVEITTYRSLPEDFSSRLAPNLARLWDGLRRLPYSDQDICAGLEMCVAFAIQLESDFDNPEDQPWLNSASRCLVEPIELEFGATDGSYSRGFASARDLAAAFRPDILSHVSNSWRNQMANNPRGILQTARNPKKVFDFPALCILFARVIAPSQVLERSTAIYYSPARLAKFGLP